MKKQELLLLTLLLLGLGACHNNFTPKNEDPDTSSLIKPLPSREASLILKSRGTRTMQVQLSEFFRKNLGGKRFNGGILVARKGVIIFERYSGYANIRRRIPIDQHTSFQLASTSKTFTGMAMLWLQQQGKLSIDDTLQKYFPDFPYQGITLKMLLNHRSGLPNYLYCCDSLWPDKNQLMSNADVIQLLTRYHPKVQYPPNTHFDYCNTNYCILGAVIEKVTGEKLGDFLARIFFKPLGMNHTYVYDPVLQPDPPPFQSLDYDYRGVPQKKDPYDGVIGDKNVFSTPEDLLKWDQALYSGKLFTDSSLALAYTPYSQEKPGIRNYGLGWRMLVYSDGKKIIYHNGWWHGNTSVFYRFIGDTTTLVILSNKYDREVYQVKPIWKILHEEDPGYRRGPE